MTYRQNSLVTVIERAAWADRVVLDAIQVYTDFAVTEISDWVSGLQEDVR